MCCVVANQILRPILRLVLWFILRESPCICLIHRMMYRATLTMRLICVIYKFFLRSRGARRSMICPLSNLGFVLGITHLNKKFCYRILKEKGNEEFNLVKLIFEVKNWIMLEKKYRHQEVYKFIGGFWATFWRLSAWTVKCVHCPFSERSFRWATFDERGCMDRWSYWSLPKK